MLTTLLPPTSGTARVAGYDIVREGAHVRESIGAALQEAALDPLLTGSEHMRLQTTLHGLPKRERGQPRRGTARARRAWPTPADRKVGGYSGGMKRRLDLALALVHRRASSSSTSRRPAWTRRAAPTCGRRSRGWRARTASP